MKFLKSSGAAVEILDELPAEPPVDTAGMIIEQFKSCHADLIVAVGGGSVMDVVKLASVLNTLNYNVRDLLNKPSILWRRVSLCRHERDTTFD
jgi:alcohol dehydrogenase class IV